MKLRHLRGNTYAVENSSAGTGFSDSASSGVYVFDDRRCLLIDSGPDQARAQQMLALLEVSGWLVYAIFNTHAHADHCGGNHFIQTVTGCRIYASAIEAAFINNPLLSPYAMYSAAPPQLLTGKFLMPGASRVTRIVEPGKIRIKRKPFAILDLAGHSLGQLGIITPDGVLFAGDSLIPREILRAHPFLYLADPGQQLNTLELLKKTPYRQLYLSHGGRTDDLTATLNANRELLDTIINNVSEIIAEPRSPEAIIREIIIRHRLPVNRNHYFRLSSSIAGVLSYLCNRRQARFWVEGNRLLYQARI
ncbi:MAG: MBL fold metallo-hydrolase [Syntrophomonadaceae bacterium]|nr:MBL fold metallo-hydrolase [Syntrophomonadaceae bacterium]